MPDNISPGSRLKFQGIFSKLAELPIYGNTVDQLYGPDLADFYNRFVGQFNGDIPIFERLLSSPSARVLDLACGSGRIGIGLARRGFQVDGLELSRDMLALVDSNLVGETEDVKGRLRFTQGDMTSFSLPDRYDLVTIGVTSVSLLLHSEQRQALFRSVRAHLKQSGKLIFDILNFSGERWKAYDNYLDVWSSELEEGTDFAIVGQNVFQGERLFTFNVYRERVGWDGTTVRAIGTSTKAWLTVEELTLELADAGLRLTESFDVEQTTYLVAQPSDAGQNG